MSAALPFGTQLIGQTEKTLNAILDRQLAGTSVTEPQWVTLTLVVMAGGSIDHAQLAERVAGALKTPEKAAEERIAELTAAGLLESTVDGGPRVSVTEAGRSLHTGIRTRVTEITERLWGDLPAEQVETAAHLLNVVLERANAELADA